MAAQKLQQQPGKSDADRALALAAVESVYAAWTTHRERAEAMQSTQAPRASELQAIAHTLYFEKKDGLLSLFEARRTRREIRQKHFRLYGRD